MVRVGLIGYGYWGPNVARNVRRNRQCRLARVADLDTRRLDAVKNEWSDVEVTTKVTDITQAKDIDAVVIATPLRSHYELALDALRHGKHVLVEKPMAESVAQCEELIQLAKKNNCVLSVDHTFVYTEAVSWMKNFIQSGQLGDVYYFDSIRANLGLFQHDASVLWDLAPHDISILLEILQRPVKSLIAVGSSHAGSRVPDIAYLTLDMGDACLAHFHVSWLSPVKVRRSLISGSKRMVIFDDLEQSEKIKIYDNGVRLEHHDIAGEYRLRVDYRIGDMSSPALPRTEALQNEVQHFVDCVSGKDKPRTGGESGLEVVRILEAAQRSIDSGGQRIVFQE